MQTTSKTKVTPPEGIATGSRASGAIGSATAHVAHLSSVDVTDIEHGAVTGASVTTTADALAEFEKCRAAHDARAQLLAKLIADREPLKVAAATNMGDTAARRALDEHDAIIRDRQTDVELLEWRALDAEKRYRAAQRAEKEVQRAELRAAADPVALVVKLRDDFVLPVVRMRAELDRIWKLALAHRTLHQQAAAELEKLALDLGESERVRRVSEDEMRLMANASVAQIVAPDSEGARLDVLLTPIWRAFVFEKGVHVMHPLLDRQRGEQDLMNANQLLALAVEAAKETEST